MGEFLENAGYIFENLSSQSKIDESVSAILNNQGKQEDLPEPQQTITKC